MAEVVAGPRYQHLLRRILRGAAQPLRAQDEDALDAVAPLGVRQDVHAAISEQRSASRVFRIAGGAWRHNGACIVAVVQLFT